MAISSRGEMGVGGGSRGGSGVRPAIAKKAFKKPAPAKPATTSSNNSWISKPAAPVVKIKSGGEIKPAVAPKAPKAPSYWELKNLPSLVKINSGTGNKTVSPIKYRRKAK